MKSNDWGKVAFAVRCGVAADPWFLKAWTKLLLMGRRDGDVVLSPAVELPHHYAADALAHSFLNGPCDSILYLDDDMLFEPSDFERLRNDKDGFEYDALSGLCLSRSWPHNPVVIEKFEDRFKVQALPQPDTIVDVAIVGLAFTLIRRECFEAVSKQKDRMELFFNWGQSGDSEDTGFSHKATAAGCKLGVNTRVCIGHRVKHAVIWSHEGQGVGYQSTTNNRPLSVEDIRQYLQQEKEMDGYSSHMAVLEALIKLGEIESVFEFGPGKFSTKLFAEKCKHTVSIEQSSTAFFQVLNEMFGELENLELLYQFGVKAGIDEMKSREGKFDLIMIDGHHRGRVEAVNAAFKKADIVVAHDTEDQRYDWGKLKVPKGFREFVYNKEQPETTVWAKDEEIIEGLKKLNKKKKESD